jgi:5-methylcytosine-specific restriction endonuclease McrA/predicted nucleic acid-binding Zn ribbon protein
VSAERTCVVCSTTMMADRSTQRYCSQRCRHLAETARRQAARGLPDGVRCEVCSALVQGKGRKRWCSNECKSEGRQREQDRRLADRPPCRRCGGPIPAERFTFCSDQCRLEAARPRRFCLDCSVVIEEKGVRRCPPCRKASAAAQLANFIEYRRLNRKAVKAADRARRRGARTAERFDPAVVFKRDGYKCQICGDRLAMKQKFPHPKSPTIDHIVPIAAGGLHELRNVQAAHMMCNSLKGAGGVDQLRLIG